MAIVAALVVKAEQKEAEKRERARKEKDDAMNNLPVPFDPNFKPWLDPTLNLPIMVEKPETALSRISPRLGADILRSQILGSAHESIVGPALHEAVRQGCRGVRARTYFETSFFGNTRGIATVFERVD